MKQYKQLFILKTMPLLWVATLFAQAPDTLWTKTFGGPDYDSGEEVQQTYDGGYIVVGVTYSFGQGCDDVYLIKTNSLGDTLWTRTYGGTLYDAGLSGQQTTDSGYIIAGLADGDASGTTGMVYLIKTDSIGDTLWTRKYGGPGSDMGHSVKQTVDGGYIVTGYTLSFGPGPQAVYLIKTDSLGDALWTKTYGGTGWDDGCEVQQTADGGYIIVGNTTSFGAGPEAVYIIKTDSLGDTLWTKTYGGTGQDAGISGRQTADGGYIIAGYTNSFNPGNYDLYVIKTDSLGDTLWTKTYGGPDTDVATSVKETHDGGYIIAGEIWSVGAGMYDIYLIKTDVNGNSIWTNTYGGPNDDWVSSVDITSDSGYILAGWTRSFGAGATDVYLIKIEPDTLGIEENQNTNLRLHLAKLEVSPNPFRDKIDIKFNIQQSTENVILQIYNATGCLIKSFNHVTNQTFNQVVWDGKNNAGKQLPAGVYFLRLETSNKSTTKKVVKLE